MRRRREVAHEIPMLRQEQDQLLLERQRQLELLEQRRLLQEQQRLFQDDVDAQMVRVARR